MRFAFPLDHPHDVPFEELEARLGGKGAALGVMARELELPVPPGFVLTTATCRAYLADGWPEGLDAEIRERMAEVEEALGRRFGDPADPLLVSVRSGAPVSMPGMMDTILNVGMTSASLVGADPAFTVACRDRLRAMFRVTVGGEPPDDAWAQLREAIEAVFRSWNNPRAQAYRAKEGIADDIGTGVTVQAMVFGNRGAASGTGVLFTRNPATGEPDLYGDILFGAQGEDVVAGTHTTEPIAVLDDRLPHVAAELRRHADRLERHFAELCDIEFTIEEGRLWMLQVRAGKHSPQAALRMAVDMAEDPSFPLSREQAVRRVAGLLADPPVVAVGRSGEQRPIGSGLPASPGIASGAVVTTSEDAIAAADAGRSVILVRSETSPEDVHGMACAAGILTARGGLASHAAVVARGWGIPAVVGASELEIGEDLIRLEGRTIAAGSVITIDGASGEVFEGQIAGSTQVVPEAATLLEWARELGVPVGEVEPEADPASRSAPVAAIREVTADDAVRALGTKGFATAQQLADALRSKPDAVQPILDQLVADELAVASAGAFRLTERGKARSSQLLATDRDAWGSEAANAALDAFLALDTRMKEAVTAWQLKAPDVVNDHADEAYDRGVLARLEELHADAVAWLIPIERACPRLGAYRPRLARALAEAIAGDPKYVASPRVDSYHGIWFELHEDLIQLAGRTREDEVAAGRA